MNPSPATLETPQAVVQPWRHPLSRWYLLPVVLPVARLLARWRVPPCGITLLGATLAAGGMAGVAFGWWGLAGTAACFWAAWCCDRLDGAVARLGGRCSPAGARLDACCDEAADLLAHLALATAAHRAGWPLAAWGLLAVFAGCKGVFLWWSHFSPKPSQSGNVHQEALARGEPPHSCSGQPNPGEPPASTGGDGRAAATGSFRFDARTGLRLAACAGASAPDKNKKADKQRQNRRATGFSQRRIRVQRVYPALPGLKPGESRRKPGAGPKESDTSRSFSCLAEEHGENRKKDIALHPPRACRPGLFRRVYHLGGNADLRWHLVWAAMLLGWPLATLGYGAGYFALCVLVGGTKRMLRASVPSAFLSPLGGSLPVQATRGTTP